MTYPVKSKEIIDFGRRYFKENGREFTALDEKFVTAVVNLINKAYQHGRDDAKPTSRITTE